MLVPWSSYRSDHHSCLVEDEARIKSALAGALNDPAAMAQIRRLVERSLGPSRGSSGDHAVIQAVADAVRSRWIHVFETEATVRARWQSYVQSLPLLPPHDRGALWSKVARDDSSYRRLVGPHDRGPRWSKTEPWEAAAALARKDDRVTLEIILSGSTGFFSRYARDSGPRMTETTGLVWQWLPRRYAARLSGSVVAHVNNAALVAHIMSVGRTGKPEDALPQFTAELEEIAEDMLANPKVSSVTVKDIRTGLTGFMPLHSVAGAVARSH